MTKHGKRVPVHSKEPRIALRGSVRPKALSVRQSDLEQRQPGGLVRLQAPPLGLHDAMGNPPTEIGLDSRKCLYS